MSSSFTRQINTIVEKVVEETSDNTESILTKNLKKEIKDIIKRNTQSKDPKYSGIPNINFSLTDKDDEREEKFSKQRIERGFDNSETWSLLNTIASFIIPRLELYEELAKDTIIRDKILIDNINKFLNALKLINRNDGELIFTDEEQQELDDGLSKFKDIFMSLWW